MGKDHIQVPLDHTSLFVSDMIDLIAQLKKALKPKTEIPALHLSLLHRLQAAAHYNYLNLPAHPTARWIRTNGISRLLRLEERTRSGRQRAV
jgi:hypothetical protein